MIHRVEITTEIGSGMVISHHFEAMYENEEEAEEFGEQSFKLSMAWMEGWGSSSND